MMRADFHRGLGALSASLIEYFDSTLLLILGACRFSN
jgi:hypothetical protein